MIVPDRVAGDVHEFSRERGPLKRGLRAEELQITETVQIAWVQEHEGLSQIHPREAGGALSPLERDQETGARDELLAPQEQRGDKQGLPRRRTQLVGVFEFKELVANLRPPGSGVPHDDGPRRTGSLPCQKHEPLAPGRRAGAADLIESSRTPYKEPGGAVHTHGTTHVDVAAGDALVDDLERLLLCRELNVEEQLPVHLEAVQLALQLPADREPEEAIPDGLRHRVYVDDVPGAEDGLEGARLHPAGEDLAAKV